MKSFKVLAFISVLAIGIKTFAQNQPNIEGLNKNTGACAQILAYGHNDETALVLNMRGIEVLDLVPTPTSPKSAVADLARGTGVAKVRLEVRDSNSSPFNYCSDVLFPGTSPEKWGEAVWGMLEIITWYDPTLATGYRATIRLKNVVLKNVDGLSSLHIKDIELPNLHWGWFAG